jgi:Kef-type K+ transport system membrane component KefB
MARIPFRFTSIIQALSISLFVIFVAILFVFLSPIFLITITQLTVRTLLGIKKRAATEGKLPLAFIEGLGLRAIFTYGLILCAAILVFCAIIRSGNQLSPALVGSFVTLGHAASDGSSSLLRQSLITLLTVIGLGQLFAFLVSRAGQPRVIGEILAGVALGPSILGALSPRLEESILPGNIAPILYVLSNIGIIIYMFDVGLQLNGSLLKNRFDKAFMISQMSIIAPMLLGAGLALVLYPAYGPKNVSFLVFALFVGVAMSITAFPVLARILDDRAMLSNAIGSLALSCAAADDVAAWCLLAVVVGITRGDLNGAFSALFLTVTYVIILLVIIRPCARKLINRFNDPALTRSIFIVLLVALLGCALTTDLIGVHAIFGAFLLGAIIPSNSRIAREFGSKINDLIGVLFLPAFFAYTGMRTQIGLLAHSADWTACIFIICVATLGKFGGAFITGRLMGLKVRDSAALGTLLNTRGLIELVVLNIGLDLGIIPPTLFTAMVIMALVTTLATSPALDFILAEKRLQRLGVGN